MGQIILGSFEFGALYKMRAAPHAATSRVRFRKDVCRRPPACFSTALPPYSQDNQQTVWTCQHSLKVPTRRAVESRTETENHLRNPNNSKMNHPDLTQETAGRF